MKYITFLFLDPKLTLVHIKPRSTPGTNSQYTDNAILFNTINTLLQTKYSTQIKSQDTNLITKIFIRLVLFGILTLRHKMDHRYDRSSISWPTHNKLHHRWDTPLTSWGHCGNPRQSCIRHREPCTIFSKAELKYQYGTVLHMVHRYVNRLGNATN